LTAHSNQGSNLYHSLLIRYALLHSRFSSIKVNKFLYDGDIVAGLECTKTIPAHTYILTSGGSMSSDNYGQAGGLSVILSSTGQLGPPNERLMLGPVRFANHECMPNCQVISGTLSYFAMILNVQQ
jgi:hypothetical protein